MAEPMSDKPVPSSDAPKPDAGDVAKAREGRKAQMDEATDEGAGKTSVPIEDVTTANDK